MAEQKTNTPPGPKVSPARTIISLVLLLIVGVICVIELRAGFGQMMTGKAMAAKSEDGVFQKVTLDEAKGMLALAPSEAIQRDNNSETEYRYEWFSLLRPLMGESSPQLFLVADKAEPRMAIAFHTSAEPDPIPASSGNDGPPAGMPGTSGPPGGGPMSMGPGGPMGMGPGGGMGMGPGGGGGPGGGRGPGGGGGRQRPAVETDGAETPETPSTTPSTTPEPPKDEDKSATPDSGATPEPGTPSEPADPASSEPKTDDTPAPANP